MRFVSVGGRGRHNDKGAAGREREAGDWGKCVVKILPNSSIAIANFPELLTTTTTTTDVGWAAPRARRVALGLKSKVLRAGPPNPLPGGVESGGGLQLTKPQ